MDANEYQIGGDHYRSEFQHWDWAIKTGQPYILGCATKYISRWRKKNGIQDLRKALHYLSKACEEGIYFAARSDHPANSRFLNQLNKQDSEILFKICQNDLEGAQELLSDLIGEIECGPSSNYIDPDSNYIKG